MVGRENQQAGKARGKGTEKKTGKAGKASLSFAFPAFCFSFFLLFFLVSCSSPFLFSYDSGFLRDSFFCGSYFGCAGFGWAFFAAGCYATGSRSWAGDGG